MLDDQLLLEELADKLRRKAARDAAKEKDRIAQANAKALAKEKAAEQQVEQIDDLIRHQFEKYKVEIRLNRSLFSSEDGFNLPAIVSEIYNESKYKISKEQIKSRMDSLITKHAQASRDAIRMAIGYAPGDAKYSQTMLTAIVRHYRDPNSISSEAMDAKVLTACLHQVKRKFLLRDMGYPNPLCFIFCGTQKIGKSWLLQGRMFRILQQAFAEAKTEHFGKSSYEKHAGVLADAYIIYLDEMQKLDEDEADNFKSFVTSPEITYRPFFTQGHVSSSNKSTVFASTNTRLSDLIFDKTGNRRFYQFTAHTIRPSNLGDYYAEINALEVDFGRIWRGIDETSPTILTENDHAEISEYQKIWAHQTLFTSFLEESEMFLPAEEESPNTISIPEITNYFRAWCAKYAYAFKMPSLVRLIEIFTAKQLSIKHHEQFRLRHDKIKFCVDLTAKERFEQQYAQRGGFGI